MGETRAKMARGSARSRRSFPGTLPQCNFEWVQHPTARGQGRCRVDWYPIRAVERDRHRRQWHMRQWKSQAVAVAQASKTAADEVGVDARVEAHLLPPNIRCARSTGPATPGSEAACTSTTPRERRGGMSKTHSGATRQGTTCSRATNGRQQKAERNRRCRRAAFRCCRCPRSLSAAGAAAPPRPQTQTEATTGGDGEADGSGAWRPMRRQWQDNGGACGCPTGKGADYHLLGMR